MTKNFETFKKEYSLNSPQVIWKKFSTDLDTPVSAALKLMDDNKFFFLLESVQSGESRGRYSLIGLDPQCVWKWEDNHSYFSNNGGEFEELSDKPLESLRDMIRDSRFDLPKELPSMASGLFGFMSYDAARSIEPSVPDSNPDPLQLPTGIYVRPRLVLVFDSVFDEVFVVYTIWPEDQYSPEVDYIKGQNSINTVMTKLKQTNIENAYSSEQKESPLEFSSNFTEATFKSVVETCKDYIRAGDIFQVVPSQRFQAPFPYKAFSFYRALRKTNPSPYLFFLNFGDFQLVGSSPEVMVRLENATMTIRPLAGTRPRGKTPAEDNALSSELLADNKEISEHLMLVDLSRHDVGRVSKPGSVKVTEQMTIEYYSHVMHISSNVDGELDPRFDALDALLSGLPLGTVSGAPKIRAMQLIDELEPVKRSFYAGSVGYFSASGDMNTCVTLRTALIKDNTLTIQSGCGVVADSDPQKEYDETVNKAKALMKAAGLTASFDS